MFEQLNFHLRNGQVLLVEGNNGSGKTSLLRILCGIRLADSGTVRWNGESIENSAVVYHSQMAYIGHLDGVKLDLTVLENLETARSLGQPSELLLSSALAQVNLAGYEDVPGRALSAGQRRRLALTRLLITVNRLWILDEPFTALDKDGIQGFEELIFQHTANGGMVVLTSHHEVALNDIDVQRIRLAL